MKNKKMQSTANEKDYKYTTTFEAIISPCEVSEAFISEASLQNLESLIPKGIDFESILSKERG